MRYFLLIAVPGFIIGFLVGWSEAMERCGQ